MSNRTKAHTIYRLLDRTMVPGTTTVLSVLNKPALLNWAWVCGRNGLDYRKVRDDAADVGTLAHAMIVADLRGDTLATRDYSPDVVDRAENALLAYWEWKKGHILETVLCEASLVSESHRYGGTIDWYGNLDGVPTLLDYKTSKALYDEHYYQVGGAYRTLLVCAGHPVEQVAILRVGRTPDESFEFRPLSHSEQAKGWTIFAACLEIWRAQKGQ